MEIKGKVAFITGGASGLGKATAEAFVAKGGKVALLDLERQKDTADKLCETFGRENALFVAADVTNEQEVKAAVAAAKDKFGAIHANYNCAGLGLPMRTVGKDGAHDLKAFQFVINVNLIGTFNTLRLCAEVMAENEPVTADGERGVIVNTASVAAFDGQIGQAAYSASKGGVAGMTLPIARDLERQCIRVCTIAPGIFDTPLMAGASDRIRKPLIDMVQFPHRLGVAPEFAQLAIHIAENTYLNGEVIRLDGGIRMAPR
ncbi:MAG: SDR family NAD(P)-dependent oxidoreductase [Gammaproteobacteria bacterium]